jgi:hypothetical protein
MELEIGPLGIQRRFFILQSDLNSQDITPKRVVKKKALIYSTSVENETFKTILRQKTHQGITFV